MEELGCTSSKVDPDVWYHAATTAEGVDYYEYVLLYTDNCLVISENAENILRKEIGKYFKLKEESIGPPSQNLGDKLSQVTLENGEECWAFGLTQYVRAAVDNVEEYLAKKENKLQAKAPAALSNGYRPEVDTTKGLDAAEASYYHSLIGVLRWIVELGRVDICAEVKSWTLRRAVPYLCFFLGGKNSLRLRLQHIV